MVKLKSFYPLVLFINEKCILLVPSVYTDEPKCDSSYFFLTLQIYNSYLFLSDY
jgi:hypothetical protein